MDFKANWQYAATKITQACQRVARNPNDVKVVVVTKYCDLNVTQQILQNGSQHVGESRVQDALNKWHHLGNLGTWHFIGHLQRNKVKDVLGKFQYLHSLDRLTLAAEIERHLALMQMKLKCFIQVNITGEDSKHGLHPNDVREFMISLHKYSHVEPIGLMTMAPRVENPEEVRYVFRSLKRLQTSLGEHALSVPYLSMGMSQDFEVAIEEGAHFIRLGSILTR